MTEMIVDEDSNALRLEDLMGLNVTLTFELINVRGRNTFEQVDQVNAQEWHLSFN